MVLLFCPFIFMQLPLIVYPSRLLCYLGLQKKMEAEEDTVSWEHCLLVCRWWSFRGKVWNCYARWEMWFKSMICICTMSILGHVSKIYLYIHWHIFDVAVYACYVIYNTYNVHAYWHKLIKLSLLTFIYVGIFSLHSSWTELAYTKKRCTKQG